MRIGSTSRVPATTDFLRQAANHHDGNGDTYITRIIEKVCDPREYLAEPDKATAVREHLNKALAPDGFSVVVVGGKALLTERQGSGGIVEPFNNKVETQDFDTVQMMIARALTNMHRHPADRVTAPLPWIDTG